MNHKTPDKVFVFFHSKVLLMSNRPKMSKNKLFEKKMETNSSEVVLKEGLSEMDQSSEDESEGEITPMAKATELYFNALHCKEEGRYEIAIEKLEKAIEIEPKQSLFYVQLGCIFHSVERYEDAVVQFKEAFKVDPKNFTALTNWANSLNCLGKYAQAAEKCKESADINPKHSTTFNNWGYALQSLRKFDEAKEKLEISLELNPNNATALNNLGNILHHLGDKDEAIAKFKEAIRINPNYSNAYHNWAMVLHTTVKYEDEIELHQKVYDLDPENPFVMTDIAFALVRLKRFDEAIDILHSIDPNSDYYAVSLFVLGMALDGLGRKKDAMKKYSECFELDPQGKKYGKWKESAPFSTIPPLDFAVPSTKAIREAEAKRFRWMELLMYALGVLILMASYFIYPSSRSSPIDESYE
jgi:tetratricopeptide (TPR) repeat protein